MTGLLLPKNCLFFLIGELISDKPDRGHSCDDEGDLTVLLVVRGHVEVAEHWFGPKRGEFAAGHQRVLAHGLINILESFDCMVLAAELLIDEVEVLSATSGPLLLSRREPFDSEVVPFPLLVNFRALKLTEEVITAREG